jgi:glycogen(starch) synthase
MYHVKILMLGWELPPHNSGGLGVACYQLCKALSNKGVDIEFVLPYTAEHNIDFMKINSAHPQDVKEVQKSGIAYDSFKYIKDSGEVEYVDLYGQSAIYEKAVERIVKVAEFNVIHAHDWLTARAAIRAKELTGKPMIVHIHSIESDRAGIDFGGNPMVREIEEMSMMIADRVIAVSEHTKRAIVREYNIPAEKIEVVHNSFDVDSLIASDGLNAYKYLEEMKANGYKVVASIGRLTMQKNLPNLLVAFKEVVKRQPKSILLMVGSGDQYYELISLSAQLGISRNVVFTDFQRGKTYRDAYSVADLFVMPSISEPFGLTPLEAIGYGTPALISRQSGVSEVMVNCLKVDFWDTDEIANQIVNVLRSDALRDELHANSLKEYRRLSWNKSADKLFDVYEQHKLRAAVAV